MEQCRQEISSKVNECLRENGVDLDQLQQNGLTEALEKTAYEKAFTHFSDQRKLNTYVNENFNHVSPVEYVLGGNRNPKKESFQYVPILKTIENLLKHEDVFSEIYEGHTSHDNVLGDFCDGDNFKQNALFAEDPMSLQIQLYYDDFTTGNPLSNKAKGLKIAGFYFVLGNLHPQFRSKLYVIQLAILCKASLVKKYGFEKVLEPLIKDLKILETDGIVIHKDGVEHVMHGTLSFLAADNLGAHGIGGFMENFTTVERVCRFCNIRKVCFEDHFRMSEELSNRSKDAHSQQVHMVSRDKKLSSFYGVKSDSCLNKLQHFHVTNGLAPDVGHDLFEGIVPEVLENAISHFVLEGYFTLEYLNKQIKEFPYDAVDKTNKPSVMAATLNVFKVKQTALQAWCLLRLLPLMVGTKVPQHDPFWEVVLLLLDVVEICASPKVSPELAGLLADVIEEFLTKYYDAAPEETSMKPKFHFLIHYPEKMLAFGPLIHCWTMRFEGKHNYFKQVYHSTRNRKNICKSLAERHEHMQASRRTKTNFLTQEGVEHSGGTMYPLILLPREKRQQLCEIVGNTEMVYKAEMVAFSGIIYFCGSAVLVKKQTLRDQFAIIDSCYIIGGEPYLLCRHVKVQYTRHFHSYTVAEEENNFGYIICQPSELVDHHPLGVYHSDHENVVYIPLKYHIDL
ncbi:uncharacterized protein [Amphiura filiformis]|uniref:uncharacterized protein n=1 Tax=Amphiura filiformis TaxID=82378 RepID=UPI003B224E06